MAPRLKIARADRLRLIVHGIEGRRNFRGSIVGGRRPRLLGACDPPKHFVAADFSRAGWARKNCRLGEIADPKKPGLRQPR